MVGKPTLRTYTFIKQIPVQGRFIDHNLTEPYKTCILSKNQQERTHENNHSYTNYFHTRQLSPTTSTLPIIIQTIPFSF